MKFTVTLDRDEDGMWVVECPSILVWKSVWNTGMGPCDFVPSGPRLNKLVRRRLRIE
jgi:hypothetical protein